MCSELSRETHDEAERCGESPLLDFEKRCLYSAIKSVIATLMITISRVMIADFRAY